MMTRLAYMTALALFLLEVTAYGASTLRHALEGEKSFPLGILAHQFKYFTLWTNVLVMVVFARITFTRRLPHDGWLAASTLWLLIVMAVWHLLLGNDSPPQGLEYVSNLLFHTVNPVLLAVWWVCFAPKSKVVWRSAAIWLLWPLLYVIYAVIRGMITGDYPYFFLNLAELGWGGLLTWSLKFLVAFYVAGLLIVAVAKALNRLSPARPEAFGPDDLQPR